MKRSIRVLSLLALAFVSLDLGHDRVVAQSRDQEPVVRQPRGGRDTAANNLYIVRMAELPVVLYEGGLPIRQRDQLAARRSTPPA